MGNYRKKFEHRETTNEIYDVNSGHLVTTTTDKEVYIPVDQDNFFMVYFENMASFYGLSSNKELNLLVNLCGRMQFDTGVVRYSQGIKKEICQELTISEQYLSKLVGGLEEKGLLKKVNGDLYLNPVAFWKGSNTTRNKLLKDGGKLRICMEFGFNFE